MSTERKDRNEKDLNDPDLLNGWSQWQCVIGPRRDKNSNLSKPRNGRGARVDTKTAFLDIKTPNKPKNTKFDQRKSGNRPSAKRATRKPAKQINKGGLTPKFDKTENKSVGIRSNNEAGGVPNKPICGIYELCTVSRTDIEVVYIGMSNNLRRRLLEYCRDGTHQSDNINAALRSKKNRKGQEIGKAFIKARYKKTEDYKAEETKLLERYWYAWNTMKNKKSDTVNRFEQMKNPVANVTNPALLVENRGKSVKNHLKPLKKFTKKATDAVKSFKKSLKQQAKNSTKKLNNSRVKKSAANVTDPLPPVEKCGNVVKNTLPPIPKCGELGQLSMAA